MNQGADYGLDIKTWEGTLAGQVNNFYSKIINREVTKPGYSSRLRNRHFFIKKRKGYKRIRFFSPASIYYKYNDWFVTDVQEVNDDSCTTDNCVRYYFLERPDRAKFVILAETCSCSGIDDFCVVQGNGLPAELCKCPCGFNQFLSTDFVKGTQREITTGNLEAIVQQANTYIATLATDGKIISTVPLAFNTLAGFKVGDYVFVNYSSNGSTSGYCGQTRRITGYSQNVSTGNYEISVDAPRLGLSATQTEGTVTIRIFEKWGKALMFASCDGVYVINTNTYANLGGNCNDQVTRICDIGIPASGNDTCILSLSDDNGRVNVLTNTGYYSYGRTGLDKFYFTTDQQSYVGTDKFVSVSYRNHILSFGKNSITTTVNTSDNNQFTYKLSENIGIWSPKAYNYFDNTFMFLANNKRLYTLGVEKDNNGYALQLQDISEPIRGMLEQLHEGDEVGIYSDSNELKIFIGSKQFDTDPYPTKTRVIIYDKQYKFWHEHHICNDGITGQYKDAYFGTGLYRYCGTKDGEGFPGAEGTIEITCELSAFIGEHESLDVLPFNMYTRKWLEGMKVILGKGVYTDNTYLEIKEHRNGYVFRKQYKGIGNTVWASYISSFIQSGDGCDYDFDYPDCLILDECEKSNDECQDCERCRRDKAVLTCQCPQEYVKYDDFCQHIKDPTANIAEVYPIRVKIDGAPSDLIEVRFISTSYDQPVLGGMLGRLKTKEVTEGDDDDEDMISYNCCRGSELKCQ